MNKTHRTASTFLGKKVIGSATYNPSLLVALPRSENRAQYDIQNDNLPFFGYDVWHAYEFSAMTECGLPVTRLLKLKYNCNSSYIVESKSLKLYLNSFNMTRFGETTDECLDICKKLIEKDLSDKLKTSVTINFLDDKTKRTEIFEDFTNIIEFADEKNLKIDKFKEAPELLSTEQLPQPQSYRLKFDSLRSNCRVTHQPDFCDVFIYYKSDKHLTETSLIKYLCSFRCEYHFHEECCEMIYKRLYNLLGETAELFVCALYTRRGGIDICPLRTNCTVEDASKLLDLNLFARNGIKQ